MKVVDLEAEDRVLCTDLVFCLTLKEGGILSRGTGPNHTKIDFKPRV